eukprot:g2351.t1
MKILKTNSTTLATFRVTSVRSSTASVTNNSQPRFCDRLLLRPQSIRHGVRTMNAINSTESSMEDTTEAQSNSRAIVVAVDETEESVKALNWTLDNFYRKNDVLHLLHVIPYVRQEVLTSTVYYTPPVLDPEITEQLYQNAKEVVNETFVPVLKNSKVEYVVDMVQEKGSETIGDAVCHAASDVDACAVVVAAHKKHWLQAWLMGSSSQEIAGKAPIPVIVYHG